MSLECMWDVVVDGSFECDGWNLSVQFISNKSIGRCGGMQILRREEDEWEKKKVAIEYTPKHTRTQEKRRTEEREGIDQSSVDSVRREGDWGKKIYLIQIPPVACFPCYR